MSFEAMTWAVKQEVPAMQKLVLLLMANRHNSDSGMCMPSHDKLAKDCCMSKSAVKAAIKSLEEKGLVEVLRRADAGVSLSNQYRLNTDVYFTPNQDGVGCQKTHPVASKPTQSPDALGHQITEGGAADAPGWGAKKPGVGRQKATETVTETVIESVTETVGTDTIPAEPKKSKFNPLIIDHAPIADDLWQSFCEHRNQLRKPITKNAAAQIVSDYAKTELSGMDAAGCMLDSIRNGWQGVFFDKARPTGAVANGKPAGGRAAVAAAIFPEYHGQGGNHGRVIEHQA